MRLGTIVAAALMTTGGLFAAEHAQAAITHYDFNIPRQSLDTALKDLAQQTGLQVGRFSDAVRGDILVGPVTGNYSAEQALQTLLAPTALTYRNLNDHAVIVLRPEDLTHLPSAHANASAALQDQPGSASAGQGNGGQEDQHGQATNGLKSSWSRLRLAQSNQGGTEGASAVGQQDERGSQKTPAALQEIVVTAQKREERAIDVPISMVAMTSDELQQRHVANIDDLTLAVPGIAIESSGWQRRISLRGIGNTFGAWPTIGMYLDEADVTMSLVAQLSLNTYDLDRVEVLRGPQGTLYGEGSAGGTIRFITKAPNLQHFQFDSDYAAVFTQYGAPGQRIQAVVNVPVIEDTLGLRLSGAFDHEGGWIDQPAADRQNINSQNLADVRIKALWTPTSQLSVSGLAEIHRGDASTNQDESPDGTYTQVFGLTTTPAVKDYFNVYNLTLKYDTGVARILNTTS